MISKQIAFQFLNKGKAIGFKAQATDYVVIKSTNDQFELLTYKNGANEADVENISFVQLNTLWNEDDANRDFHVVENF